MVLILEFISILSAGLFCGAAFYITLVEHPARMACGTQLAVTEFGPSYKRAAIMQALLAALSFITAITTWLMTSEIYWLGGGVLMGIIIPYTLIVIFPTNKLLLAPSLDKGSNYAAQLLNKWGKLHMVRSILSLIALLLFLLVILKK